MAAKPRRRVQIRLDLGADSWEDAAHALRDLATQLDMGYCRQGSVSGGYSSGYALDASEDESVTHESWHAALQEYVNAEKE